MHVVKVLGVLMIIIVVIGICVVLPLMVIWLINKRKNHENGNFDGNDGETPRS